MKNRKIIFGILTIFTTMFIFGNSLQPAEVSSESSGFFVNLLSWFFGLFDLSFSRGTLTVIIRKAAHITEFTMQSLAVCGLYRSYNYNLRQIKHSILYIGLLTACVDEAIQLLTDGRSGMIQDVFIDFSGTVLGLIISLLIVSIISKKSE